MKRPRPRRDLAPVRQALDEARFGASRTLNLRASWPTVDDAVVRAEAWLRQRQVERAEETLVITGRGKGSDGGFSPVRDGVLRLLHALRRRGVVASFQEHTAGSFVVTLAPVNDLWERPRRNRARGGLASDTPPPGLEGLDPQTRTLLRDVARQSLERLGVKTTDSLIVREMRRQRGILGRSIESAENPDARLRAALRAALERED